MILLSALEVLTRRCSSTQTVVSKVNPRRTPAVGWYVVVEVTVVMKLILSIQTYAM